MKQKTGRLALAGLIAAVGVAACLCVCLAWMLSISQFDTTPGHPPLATPLTVRYERFLMAVLCEMLLPVAGVAIAVATAWRRCKIVCYTLGVVLLHRLVVFHILFVMANSHFRN